MKEYIKNHLFQFISLIPVCFIAIGAFVLNIYLYQFGIVDIVLFDSKTIFVGFITVFQIVCYFFLFCTFFSDVGNKHGYLLFIVNMLWKPALFSILIYLLLGNEDRLGLFYSGWNYNLLRIMMSIPILFFLGLVVLHSEKNIANLKTKRDKKIVDIVVFIELSSTYCACSFLFDDFIFQKIYETYMNLSIFCLIFVIIILYRNFPLIVEVKGSSFFRLGDKPIQMDYFYAYFFIIVFLMISLVLYSTRVFPYVSNNLGGGYYKFNKIVFDDDTYITGKIIYNNSNYVYVVEEENQLSQYPINTIKRYEFIENAINDSKEYDEPVFEIVEKEISDIY